MSLATLTSKEVSRVQKLVERKEALANQITEINRELEVIESGLAKPARPVSLTTRPAASPKAAAPKPAKAAAPAVPKKKGQGGQTGRGQLRAGVAGQLKAAGKAGMKVKDLATKLGTNYRNITAFFQSTAKKIREIKKVGPAHYVWVGA